MTKNKNLVNVSLQIVPINCTNAYDIIDAGIHTIQDSGIKHEVQPFSTIMEGELEELLKIVLKAREAAVKKGGNEMILNIQLHSKESEDVTFEGKTGKFKG
jgi:uncharacterized protein YqgV (UPF0045/DUF77 family)